MVKKRSKFYVRRLIVLCTYVYEERRRFYTKVAQRRAEYDRSIRLQFFMSKTDLLKYYSHEIVYKTMARFGSAWHELDGYFS